MVEKKSLTNLTNGEQFIKVFPSNLFPVILFLWRLQSIRQSFARQVLSMPHLSKFSSSNFCAIRYIAIPLTIIMIINYVCIQEEYTDHNRLDVWRNTINFWIKLIDRVLRHQTRFLLLFLLVQWSQCRGILKGDSRGFRKPSLDITKSI